MLECLISFACLESFPLNELIKGNLGHSITYIHFEIF